jgi:uncharacterized protein (DUF1330 family)
MNTPAYLVIRVNVTDWDVYGEYMKHTPRVLNEYGGRFIARGANPETLEGEPENLRIVIVEFPSMERAKSFYNSKDYQALKQMRGGAAEAQFVAIDAYPIDEWQKAVEASQNQPDQN